MTTTVKVAPFPSAPCKGRCGGRRYRGRTISGGEGPSHEGWGPVEYHNFSSYLKFKICCNVIPTVQLMQYVRHCCDQSPCKGAGSPVKLHLQLFLFGSCSLLETAEEHALCSC